MTETIDRGVANEEAKVVKMPYTTKDYVEQAVRLLRGWSGHLLVDRSVTAFENVVWLLVADFTYEDLSIKLTVRGNTDEEVFSALVELLRKIL